MWKAVNYEVCGRGHKKVSMPCQDKTLFTNFNNVSLIALADGAGSARLSHFGAEAVLKAAGEYITTKFDQLINNEDGKQVKVDLLNYLLEQLKILSQELKCEVKELASTFLMVAVKDNSFLICHIGDGVIGYLKHNELKIASKPENGEFANTTIFVTSKNAIASMKLFKGNINDISGFVIMSDGTAESFYNKKEEMLAPVLTKIMHRTALVTNEKIFDSIKNSFDSVIVNNTQDDCSIAIMSRKSAVLCDYKDMSINQKCELLGIKYIKNSCKKQIYKYDNIINILHTSKTLEQIAGHLHLKKKYVRRYLNNLVKIGLIVTVNQGFRLANPVDNEV